MTEKNFKGVDRIIVMSLAPINRTLSEAIFLNIFTDLGIKIEFWNLSKVLTGVEYDKEVSGHQGGEIQTRHIENRKDLKLFLSQVNTDNTLLNVQIYFESRFFWFFRILTQLNLNYFVSIVGIFPSSSLTEKGLQLLYSPRLAFKKAYLKSIKIIVNRFGLVNKPEFAFVAGSVAENISSSKKNININARDYDHILFANKRCDIEFNGGEKYIVFIDQGIGGHPDEAIISGKVNERLDQYYIKLNLFFDTLENLFNMKIIVASHPRCENGFQFGHREVIKDMTLELISNAEFVLAQFSTAISYAVIEEKPMLFFFSDYMKRGGELELHYYNSIKAFANELGCNLINIDDFHEHMLIFKKDSSLYNKYKYKYLTSGTTENRSNYEIMHSIFCKKQETEL